MARKWSIWFVAAALVAVLAGLGVIGASAAPPATADATAVTQWNIIAISDDRRDSRTRASGARWRGTAGISNQHGNGPGGRLRRGQRDHAEAPSAVPSEEAVRNTASDEAAVATAAYLVLKNIVETVPQSITFPEQGDPARVARVAVPNARRTRYPTRRSRTGESLPGPRRRKP